VGYWWASCGPPVGAKRRATRWYHTSLRLPLTVYHRAMQQHDQHDPRPEKPEPGSKHTKLLLLVIAVLVSLVVSQIAKRFM